jgi:DNA (cytosine-5)-methyltransferase 1
MLWLRTPRNLYLLPLFRVLARRGQEETGAISEIDEHRRTEIRGTAFRMTAYYNENDEDKAAWLRELIRKGIVAPGEVDTRSISAVWPEDLAGFSQHHFFAGIGVWSYALRLAGWPDDRPVWTGSCPCPSFSAAGKGGGFDDPRHLWPDWARLIRKCRPATIFGEQADDAIGYGWLDLVQTDLEREDYAVGKAVLGACSVGAPHIRQRLYFVAHAQRSETLARLGEIQSRTRTHNANGFRDGGIDERMAHTDSERCRETGICARESRPSRSGADCELADSDRRGQSVRGEPSAQHDGELRSESVCRMGNADSAASEQHGAKVSRSQAQGSGEWFGNGHQRDGHSGAGFVNGFWRGADWVLRKRWNSEDWEWCPTEPGTFPLVAGTTNRVLKLRGYGDAICAEVAKAFIEASMIDSA